MAWRLFGDKPLSEPMLTRFTDAYTALGGDELTHRGRDKIAAILQMIFWNAFSWMKMYDLRLKYQWNLCVGVQLTIFQHWFRKWLGADQATSHYLKQWWLIYWRMYVSLGLSELNFDAMSGVHMVSVWLQVFWGLWKPKSFHNANDF